MGNFFNMINGFLIKFNQNLNKNQDQYHLKLLTISLLSVNKDQLIIERENDIVILDAKYKLHWEELVFNSWSKVEDVIRQQHREDLLQILAYSTLTDKKNITSCLIYPCREATWKSMISRNRIFHKAFVYAGNRKINIILTAIPMTSDQAESTQLLSRALQN